MKVLLFNGSPRKKGCTYTALSEVADSLEQQGMETEILQIGAEPVRDCIGCNRCGRNSACVFTDDVVNKWLARAETADRFIRA